MPTVTVRVPASSANLGPGFDCLGLSVGIHNQMQFTWGPDITESTVVVHGEGADELDHDNNAALASFRLGLSELGHPFMPVTLVAHNRIPLARGLGSSASAIVAGLAAARALAGQPVDRDWLLRRALLIEPHPDNVAAAIYGGLTAAMLIDEDNVRCLRLRVPPGLRLALAVPAFHVSTAEARSVLPQQYTREDVVFSSSRAAILVAAILTGAFDWLDEAVRDRIHTPARACLIPGFKAVRAAACDAGAAGVFISGSGPTMAAFVVGGEDDAKRVAHAMTGAFETANVQAAAHWPSIDADGVQVVPVEPARSGRTRARRAATATPRSPRPQAGDA